MTVWKFLQENSGFFAKLSFSERKLLDNFAGKALTGLLSGDVQLETADQRYSGDLWRARVADDAYLIAIEMILASRRLGGDQ